jgi:hypothetical protein
VDEAMAALQSGDNAMIDGSTVKCSYAADNRVEAADGRQRGSGRGPPKRPLNIAATFQWDDKSGYAL